MGDVVMHFRGRLLFCVLLPATLISALAAPDADFFFIQVFQYHPIPRSGTHAHENHMLMSVGFGVRPA
jgi:hypothetical protein